MKKAELVFIPSPGIGHLVSTVEIAKLLVERNDQLSITVLIMKFPFESKLNPYTESLAASNLSTRIKFIDLSNDDQNPEKNGPQFISFIIESHKPYVKEAVTKITQSESGRPDSPRLAGFVIDMFCTTMIDVANEFGVPSYVFFTSGAAFLGLMLHLQALHDDQNVDTTEFKNSDAELAVPSLVNPLPARVLPNVVLNKDVDHFFEFARRIRETKGIMVNTFMELESYAVNSLSDGPIVYPVGPILNIKRDSDDSEITKWLDDQPPSSVVFLCFGSMGSFGEVQVKEIACALEQSGHRFLWSLRQPPPKGKMAIPSEYTNLEDVLPEGFLDRTVGIGKVIGWAPQVAILTHPAIEGFVSHCGWNSTLESLWFGVPIATWPMYAEQQFNAFELVKELGLAVDIKMDYRKDFVTGNEIIVSAEEIERGIRCLMDHGSEIRKKVKELSEKSRKALMNGGSSYISLGHFTEDVMQNMPL